MSQLLVANTVDATVTFKQVTNSPFMTGPNPVAIAFSPVAAGNLFAAVTTEGNSSVAAYSINQTTGAFSQVEGSPFSTGIEPYAIALSPLASGQLFAAITDLFTSKITVFHADRSTGLFREVAGSPFSGASIPTGIAFSPLASENLFAAVADFGSNCILLYQVDQASGTFTLISDTAPTESHPQGIAFSPLITNNLFVAVANEGDNSVSVYLVDHSTGDLIEVAGSPFPARSGPIGIAFSPVIVGNLFAAVTNNGDNSVSVYQVDSTTGIFTPVSGSPFKTGAGPRGIAFSPLVLGNCFAAIADENDSTVSVYQVDLATGAFTPVLGSPFPTGSAPMHVAFSPFAAGKLFLATSNSNGNNISVYEAVIPSERALMAIFSKYYR